MRITHTIITMILMTTVIGISCSRRPKLERPAGIPELYPCSITVTFGGQPIEGVTVSLVPEKRSEWKPSGATNKRGIALPSTSYGFQGVPEGKYIVAFTKLVTNPDYNENDHKSPYAQSLIPLKYGLEESKEKIEIQAGEKNKFSYDYEAGEEWTPQGTTKQ